GDELAQDEDRQLTKREQQHFRRAATLSETDACRLSKPELDAIAAQGLAERGDAEVSQQSPPTPASQSWEGSEAEGEQFEQWLRGEGDGSREYIYDDEC
ncbi:unnamed protein product, partial [Prorocentrum cordatum]